MILKNITNAERRIFIRGQIVVIPAGQEANIDDNLPVIYDSREFKLVEKAEKSEPEASRKKSKSKKKKEDKE